MYLPGILAFLAAAEAVMIPNPTGPYQVAMDVFGLTDYSRIDRLAPPSPHPPKRRVAVSVFLPLAGCHAEVTPYMPPATAQAYGLQAAAAGLPNNTFEQWRLDICKISNSQALPRQQKFPLFLFSSSFGSSRLVYSAMAAALASEGYVVVTVDHPYDADIVEFPDGSIILGGNISETESSISSLAEIRTTDMSFVLNQLLHRNHENHMSPLVQGSIDFARVAASGHSLGGATAALMTLFDDRVRGGVNLDGGLWDQSLNTSMDKPFLQLGRPDHRKTDDTWAKFWKELKGSKLELSVNGTIHNSFTDLPLIIGTLDIPASMKPAIDDMFGSIKGTRLRQIVTSITTAFAELIFSGDNTCLRQVTGALEEVHVVDSRLD